MRSLILLGFIPPTTMLPPHRLADLLTQAANAQRLFCLYHNAPRTPTAFSLLTDHRCSREVFPLLRTHVLKAHTDEIWNIRWSHDGRRLASASKDRTAFIWLIGVRLLFCF